MSPALLAIAAIASIAASVLVAEDASPVAGSSATPSAPVASAGRSHHEVAAELQNPFTDLILLPFQNITATGFDPGGGFQDTLNIQPAVPLALNDRWKLIVRPILPVIRNTWPESSAGIGDLQFEPFFSPVSHGSFVWGFGPVLSLPTASHDELGTGKYTAGPAFALFGQSGSWTYSVIATQQWSFAGDSDRDDVSLFNLQPTVSYNLRSGWYVMSGPLISADWTAASGQQWIVPLGGGFGKVFSIDRHRLSLSLEHYRNVEHPDSGPDALTILTLTFVFRE